MKHSDLYVIYFLFTRLVCDLPSVYQFLYLYFNDYQIVLF
jgi:hypothetical protein